MIHNHPDATDEADRDQEEVCLSIKMLEVFKVDVRVFRLFQSHSKV